MAKRKKKYKPTVKAKCNLSAVSNIEQPRKDTLKPKLGTNYATIGLPVLLAILQFIFTSWFLPSKVELLGLELKNETFLYVNILFSALTLSFIMFYKKKYVKHVFGVVWLLLVLVFIANDFLIRLLEKENFVANYASLYTFSSSFFTVPMIWGGWLLWHVKHKVLLVQEGLLSNKWLLLASMLIVGGVSFFLLENRLGELDFFEDEFQVVSAAKGFQETGKFNRWDFVKEELTDSKYDRAWIHSALISYAYDIWGLSEWSSRIVSVLMGVITCCLILLFTYGLTRNVLLGLLAGLTAMLHPNFFHLFRYARMYAVWIPLLMVTTYFLVWGVIKPSSIKFKNEDLNKTLQKYVNFNWLYLLIGLVLAGVSYMIHRNTAILFIGYSVFLFYLGIIKKQYILLIFPISLGSLFFYYLLFDPDYFFMRLLTFFGIDREQYSSWLLGFPVSYGITSALMLAFVPVFSLKRSQHIYVFGISVTLTTLVFFRYIIDYVGFDFRFISAMVPIVIIYVFVAAAEIPKAVLGKWAQYILPVTFLVLSVSAFQSKKEEYYKGTIMRPKYREAYGILKDKHQKGEVVFGQYLRTPYLAEFYRNNKIINLGSLKRFSSERFQKELQQNPRGWVVWSSRKNWHINDTIQNMVLQNFKKYSGMKVDSTFIEVYYYDESMLPGRPEYSKRNKNIFNTNVYFDFKKPFTITFWLRNFRTGSPAPLLLENGEAMFQMSCTSDSSITFSVSDNKKLVALPAKQWNHISIQYSPNNDTGCWLVYKNSQKAFESTSSVIPDEWLRLHINMLYRGELQDIRVFKELIGQAKIQAIYNNGNMILDEDVPIGKSSFKPLHHFVKR